MNMKDSVINILQNTFVLSSFVRQEAISLFPYIATPIVANTIQKLITDEVYENTPKPRAPSTRETYGIVINGTKYIAT